MNKTFVALAASAALLLFLLPSGSTKSHFQFLDPELPKETRVNNLVSLLTFEEKVYQMLNTSPAILHLQIPYDLLNTCPPAFHEHAVNANNLKTV